MYFNKVSLYANVRCGGSPPLPPSPPHVDWGKKNLSYIQVYMYLHAHTYKGTWWKWDFLSFRLYSSTYFMVQYIYTVESIHYVCTKVESIQPSRNFKLLGESQRRSILISLPVLPETIRFNILCVWLGRIYMFITFSDSQMEKKGQTDHTFWNLNSNANPKNRN